jgi:hypothetical protein
MRQSRASLASASVERRTGELVSNPKPKRPSRSSYRRRDRAASAAADPRQLALPFDEPGNL